MELKKVKLEEILPPVVAMRSEIEQEGINELATSIMEVGLINPLTLRRKGKKYEIIAGFRRFQALRQLQFHEIDANVIEGNENVVLQMRMDENIVRQSVSELDEAIYLEAIAKQLDLNQTELASKIGKSASYVNERLQILAYPPDLLRALKGKLISFSVAREFNRSDDIRAIREWLRWSVAGVNARTARQWVQRWEEDKRGRLDDTAAPQSEPEPFEERIERTIMGECMVCHAAVDSRRLRAIWACPECHLECAK